MNLLPGAILLLTAACAPAPPPEESGVPAPQGQCDAAKAQALVGRPASTELATEAQRLAGAGAVRWLVPGQIITMEFRADRLNLELDARRVVIAIRCG